MTDEPKIYRLRMTDVLGNPIEDDGRGLVGDLRENAWQYKESSKRSKRNHGDYRMNFSRLEYRLLMTAIIGCIACAILGLFGSVFCVMKMF